MARIRTIKPDFWTDEKLTECSMSARLLFIGTWNFADDAGNLDRSAKQIKARVFPLDDVDCEPLLRELIAQGLLTEYSVNGKNYLHICGFTKHQLINRPSKPTCPAYDNSPCISVTLTEPSVTTHHGREGKEGKGSNTTARTEKKPSVHAVAFDPETGTFTGLNGQMQIWRNAYPAVSIETEINKAAAWLVANPKNKKSNYSRFLSGWLSRAQDKARPQGGKPASTNDYGDT